MYIPLRATFKAALLRGGQTLESLPENQKTFTEKSKKIVEKSTFRAALLWGGQTLESLPVKD